MRHPRDSLPPFPRSGGPVAGTRTRVCWSTRPGAAAGSHLSASSGLEMSCSAFPSTLMGAIPMVLLRVCTLLVSLLAVAVAIKPNMIPGPDCSPRRSWVEVAASRWACYRASSAGRHFAQFRGLHLLCVLCMCVFSSRPCYGPIRKIVIYVFSFPQELLVRLMTASSYRGYVQVVSSTQ